MIFLPLGSTASAPRPSLIPPPDLLSTERIVLRLPGIRAAGFAGRSTRAIPKGLGSFSPGLRGTSYPGKASQNETNPESVESTSLFGHARAMPQSLAKILVHTVFSTKERRPFLRDKLLREELHRYLGGILTNHDCQPLIIGGVEDQRLGLIQPFQG